jgi:TonB family protein
VRYNLKFFMAHQPTLLPDPPEHSGRTEEPTISPAPQPELVEPGNDLHLEDLTAALASHGGGTHSADLALDLLLHEIVEQARLATTATGAAIALFRQDEMVCRATTGTNAPGLGDRLSTRSGLSGACIQTRRVQRCDDTEFDPRVDAAFFRGVEVRSILMVPIMDGEEVAGLFQILSPRANAFSDRDTQTVQALCRRILDNIHRAAEVSVEPASAPSPASIAPIANQNPVELPPPPIASRVERKKFRPRDHWTDILNATVIALSLLLGWMLGRAEWQRVTGTSKSQVSNTLSSRATEGPSQIPVTSPMNKETNPRAAEKRTDAGSNQSKTGSRTNVPPASDLVVYENGKVVFRMTPAPKNQTKAGIVFNSEAMSNAVGNVAVLSPEVARDYLIHRVEPQYPEAARSQHIQGPVTLTAVVSEDGRVRTVTVLSGDSALAAAALDAVRQWRFKPYRVNGQAREFATHITVNFKLR